MFEKIWNFIFGKKCECKNCKCTEPTKVEVQPKVEVINDVSSTPLTVVEEPVKEKKVKKPTVKKTVVEKPKEKVVKKETPIKKTTKKPKGKE
jgi:hypothetical protein